MIEDYIAKEGVSTPRGQMTRPDDRIDIHQTLMDSGYDSTILEDDLLARGWPEKKVFRKILRASLMATGRPPPGWVRLAEGGLCPCGFPVILIGDVFRDAWDVGRCGGCWSVVIRYRTERMVPVSTDRGVSQMPVGPGETIRPGDRLTIDSDGRVYPVTAQPGRSDHIIGAAMEESKP
jgi:hypothetical protein